MARLAIALADCFVPAAVPEGHRGAAVAGFEPDVERDAERAHMVGHRDRLSGNPPGDLPHHEDIVAREIVAFEPAPTDTALKLNPDRAGGIVP